MNNRLEEINRILKDLYISVLDENIVLNGDAIYHYLSGRSFNNAIEINNESNRMFDRWCNRFKNRSNIKVFVDDNWKYFCQFTNDDITINGTLDYIKLYIPLDLNHIEEGANRIFDFLERNNIKHHSKIATHVRTDDVVIRLYRKEDAMKLQDFVSRDNYIMEGMLKVNPFCFNNDGVGYSYDNMSSYNDYVSSLIADYINVAYANGASVDDINRNSFLRYAIDVGYDLVKMNSLLDSYDRKNKRVYLTDACVMNDLLKLSLQSNDINEYYSFYDRVRTFESRKNLERVVLSRYNEQLTKNTANVIISSNNNVKEDKESLFKEFILVTMKKYFLGYDKKEPNKSGWAYIVSYINGKKEAVTRDCNLRERVNTNLSREDIYDIVNNSGIIGNNIYDKINNYIRKVMLDDIIKSMKERMPDNYITNLNGFLSNNNLKYITSNGEARYLAKTMRANDMRRFMYDMGVNSIEEYINKYYNEEENRRMKR